MNQLRRALPLLFAGVALSEFALKWWPYQELKSIVSGRPEHSWYDYRSPALPYYGSPVSFALLLGAVALSVGMFRRWHPWRNLPHPSTLAWLALSVLFIAQVACYAFARVSFYDDKVGWAYAALGVLFKLLAAFSFYQDIGGPRRTSTSWQPTVPLSDEPIRPAQSFRTTVAVAFALYPVLPVWDTLLQISQIFSLPFIASLRFPGTGYGSLTVFVCKAGLQLFVARLLLRTCFQKGMLRVERDNWPARVSYRLLLLYGLLAPIAIVLSAIPYGGGHIPAELRLLLSGAQLLGLVSLLLMLPQPTRDVSERSDPHR